MYLKVPAFVFTLFPNKSACIYDNKHASKQIPWIDEFQNEKDIQLSLVNIMPFRYRAALLHWLPSGSLDQFAGVGSSLCHKNDMFCLPGVVLFFFLAKFYEWALMHLLILRGRNPRRPMRIHLFVCRKSFSAHLRRASRQLLAKEYTLKTGKLPQEGFHGNIMAK